MYRYLFLFPALLFSNELELIFEEADEIAREKSINLKDMPSSVTLLEQKDFIGARTLLEALASLPNVELSTSSIGWDYLVIRGYKTPNMSSFDKVKIFIDGIPVNELTTGSAHFYLNLPIELIEKIRVFRGANSANYGNGASAGAISVTTKIGSSSFDDEIFVKNWGSGFLISDDNLFLDGYKDGESFGVGANMFLSDFQFYTRYKRDVTENFYGLSEVWEEEKGQQEKESIISKLSTRKYLGFGEFSSEVGISLFKNSSTFQKYNSNDKKRLFSEIEEWNYYDRYRFANVEFEFDKFGNNYLTIGARYEKMDSLGNSKKSFIEKNRREDDFTYLFTEEREKPFTNHNSDEVLSLYFRDLYTFGNDLDFSLNGRIENSENSFQFGSIYRFSDESRVKGVYNRAYRLPSWSEESESDLEIEKLEGLEISLIYEDLIYETLFELNLFQYENSQTIETEFYDIDDDFRKDFVPVDKLEDFEKRFSNSENKTLNRGLELNFGKTFLRDYEFNFNYGFVDTEHLSRHLIKSSFLAQLLPNLSSYTQFYFVDEIDKDEIYIKPYNKIDQTLSYSFENSTLKLYIKNLLNRDIFVESFTTAQKDGLKKEGRELFFSYVYKF
jgi:outer membrane cobalamin receptor